MNIKKDTFEWDGFWHGVEKKTILGNILYILREKIWVKAFLKVALKYTKCGKILEAGSGSCMSSILLSKERGDEITAIDLNPIALEVAKKTALKYSVKITLIQSSIEKIDYPDNFFDLCWNSGTMEHFKDPKPILREMLRVGQRVIVIIPAKSIIWDLFLNVVAFFGKRITSYFNEGYTKFYSKEEIQFIFKEVTDKDFVVEEMYLLGIFRYLAIIC